jgi:hypothetical protein
MIGCCWLQYKMTIYTVYTRYQARYFRITRHGRAARDSLAKSLIT